MNNDKENKSEIVKSELWWQAPIKLFLRLSGWVAAPVVLAALLGNWLDEKFSSAPWGLLILVGLSFAISMFGLVHETAKEFKRINKKND